MVPEGAEDVGCNSNVTGELGTLRWIERACGDYMCEASEGAIKSKREQCHNLPSKSGRHEAQRIPGINTYEMC